MRLCGIKSNAIGLSRVLDVGLECIGVITVGVIEQLRGEQRRIGLLAIGSGLHGRSQDRRAVRTDSRGGCFLAIGIADPLIGIAIGAWHQLGHDQADVGNGQVAFDLAIGKDRKVHLRRTGYSDRSYASRMHHSERR